MNAKHNVCYVNKFPFIAPTLDLDMIRRLPLLEFCIILATNLGQLIKSTVFNELSWDFDICMRQGVPDTILGVSLDLWKVNLTSQRYIYGSRPASIIISVRQLCCNRV